MKTVSGPSRRGLPALQFSVAFLMFVSWSALGGARPVRRILTGKTTAWDCSAEVFNVGQVIPTDPEPFSLAIADFDKDGNLDFVVGSLEGGKITTYLGDGAGTFRLGPIVAAGQSVVALASADFNGDGKADLVVAADNQVSIYLGDGTGGFSMGASIGPLSGGFPILVAAADLDGNGSADVLVVTDLGTEETLYTFLNDGAGRHQASPLGSLRKGWWSPISTKMGTWMSGSRSAEVP